MLITCQECCGQSLLLLKRLLALSTVTQGKCEGTKIFIDFYKSTPKVYKPLYSWYVWASHIYQICVQQSSFCFQSSELLKNKACYLRYLNNYMCINLKIHRVPICFCLTNWNKHNNRFIFFKSNCNACLLPKNMIYYR